MPGRHYPVTDGRLLRRNRQSTGSKIRQTNNSRCSDALKGLRIGRNEAATEAVFSSGHLLGASPRRLRSRPPGIPR